MDGRSAGGVPASAEHPGPTDGPPAALVAENSAAAAHFRAGRYPQAIEAFRRVLGTCRTELGADHVDTLTVAGNLAVALVAAGRRRPGLAQLEANLADRVRVLGDTAPLTLTARDALATALRVTGNVDDAVELAKRVTAQRLRRLGASDPDTLTSRMGLIRAVVPRPVTSAPRSRC